MTMISKSQSMSKKSLLKNHSARNFKVSTPPHSASRLWLSEVTFFQVLEKGRVFVSRTLFCYCVTAHHQPPLLPALWSPHPSLTLFTGHEGWLAATQRCSCHADLSREQHEDSAKSLTTRKFPLPPWQPPPLTE